MFKGGTSLDVRTTPAAPADRYTLIKRVRVARVTPALIRELTPLFETAARDEADRATRRWFVAHRHETLPAGELADLTLAFYERALRRFRPYVEVDYDLRGERCRTRYGAITPFLRWAENRRGYRVRALGFFFATPHLAARLCFTPGGALYRSYVWAEGLEQAGVERLTSALTAAIRPHRGSVRFLRSRLAAIVTAGVAALAAALGTSFLLPLRPWLLMAAAAAVVDGIVLSLFLLLNPRAWPPVYYDLPGESPGVHWRRAAGRAIYVALWFVCVLGGTAAILISLFHILW